MTGEVILCTVHRSYHSTLGAHPHMQGHTLEQQKVVAAQIEATYFCPSAQSYMWQKAPLWGNCHFPSPRSSQNAGGAGVELERRCSGQQPEYLREGLNLWTLQWCAPYCFS